MELENGRVPQAAPGSREPSREGVSAASGFDPSRGPRFTNASYMNSLSVLLSMVSKELAQTTYGAWNPHFCAADASDEAAAFIERVRDVVNHWERRIGDSDGGGQ